MTTYTLELECPHCALCTVLTVGTKADAVAEEKCDECRQRGDVVEMRVISVLVDGEPALLMRRWPLEPNDE
jgi:exosome complex RNA-binding protein Rrp4